jgi:hypothetical protein
VDGIADQRGWCLCLMEPLRRLRGLVEAWLEKIVFPSLITPYIWCLFFCCNVSCLLDMKQVLACESSVGHWPSIRGTR